jgi:hypothetical protein
MADVTNDDIATIEEIQGIFGGVVAVDTGWRARSYDDSWKVAWVVQHPPKDCEHVARARVGRNGRQFFRTTGAG